MVYFSSKLYRRYCFSRIDYRREEQLLNGVDEPYLTTSTSVDNDEPEVTPWHMWSMPYGSTAGSLLGILISTLVIWAFRYKLCETSWVRYLEDGFLNLRFNSAEDQLLLQSAYSNVDIPTIIVEQEGDNMTAETSTLAVPPPITRCRLPPRRSGQGDVRPHAKVDAPASHFNTVDKTT